VDRLAKALRKPAQGDVRLDRQVPGYSDPVRPDIVVINEEKKTVAIVDVAIPFENRPMAFNLARQEKERKYAGVVEHFKSQGYTTTCEAFIVGSLGGYDNQNTAALRSLGVSYRYAVLMKRLMVSDVIRWSRDMYIEHLTGHRQYSETPKT
jgi:hypothetical protein